MMRLDFSIFRINDNVTPAQLKRSGIALIVMGLFIAMGSAALLALVMGAPVPAFMVPDGVRLDHAAREPPTIGAVILVASLTAFGFVAIAEGIWRMIFGARNMKLMRVMLLMLAALWVGGFVASSMMGRRFGSLAASGPSHFAMLTPVDTAPRAACAG